MTLIRQWITNMSIITLFTKTAPTINGYEFDAILEDTLEASVEWTKYPIASGANASDHGIILPIRWQLIGVTSNNPLGPSLTDFTGVLAGALDLGPVGSQIAGMAAGLLAGSNDTRASETLNFLMTLMFSREPFDIDAGDIQLTNMVIGDIRRTKTPVNENGLEFDVALQERPTLDTVLSANKPKQNQLNDNDPAKSQAAASVDRGELSPKVVDKSTQAEVNKVP